MSTKNTITYCAIWCLFSIPAVRQKQVCISLPTSKRMTCIRRLCVTACGGTCVGVEHVVFIDALVRIWWNIKVHVTSASFLLFLLIVQVTNIKIIQVICVCKLCR